MALIDPMAVPYMQQAFGGGPLTERGMKQILQGSSGMGGAGGLLGGGVAGPGIGAAAPMPQAPGLIEHGSSGRGPNSMLMGALGGGNQASYDPLSGNWTPGSGGFPVQQEGGGGGSALGNMAKIFAMSGGGK